MAHFFTDIAFTTLNTSTGNQTISFATAHGTPALVAFLVPRTTLDIDETGAPEVDGNWCFGVTDGTNQWVISFTDEDGGAYNVGSRGRTTRCIQILDPSTGLVDGAASIVSFGTGQVTINVDNAPASAYKLAVWGIFGDNIGGHVGSLTCSSSQDGTATETITGFDKVTGLILGCIDIDGFGSLQTDAAHFALGFASDHDGTISQSGVGYNFLASGNGNSATQISETYALPLARYNVTPISESVKPEIEVTAMGDGEFTLTTRTAAVGIEVGYAAISGCMCFAGPWTFPTGTGDKTFAFPTGEDVFETRGGILLPNRINATDVDSLQNGALAKVGSIALFTTSDGTAKDVSIAWARENNAGTANTETRYDDEVLNCPDHTGGSGHEGSFSQAEDNEGHTVNVSVGVSNEKLFPQFILGVRAIRPSALSVPVSLKSPTLAAILKPDVLAASVSLGSPTLAAILKPEAFAAAVALGEPTILAPISPATLAVSVALGSPSLSAIIQPDVLAAGVAFGEPVLVEITIIQPDVLVAGVAFGEPSLAAIIAPDVLAAAVVFGEPDVAAFFSLFPETLEVATAFGTPTLVAVLEPDVLAAGVTLGEPVVSAILAPDAFSAAVAFGQPSLLAQIAPDTLGVAVSLGALRIVIGVIPTNAPSPAGNIAQSGPEAAQVSQSGPVQAQAVQSGPEEGQSAQSGPMVGNASQSGPKEGQVSQSGPVAGNAVQSGPEQGQVSQNA